MIPYFATQFRVIAMEQMGHGRTADAQDRPFHYHDMAEDMVELMRQLGIESAIVVGYQRRGIIGLDMAIHHPERVTKLAVTGAQSRNDGYTAENLEWIRTVQSRRRAGIRSLWPPVARRRRPLADRPRTPAAHVGRGTRLHARGNAEHQGADPDHLGDGDIVTPEHAVEMFRTIPGAQLCVVPHAGHGVMPKETILTFLNEPPAGEKYLIAAP